MNYFNSDISNSTNTLVYIDGKDDNLYLSILICLTVQILIRLTFLAKTSQILYDNIHIINLKLSVTLFINNENICLFTSISLLINSNKKKRYLICLSKMAIITEN
jgi:hypothetical protein